jgi:thiol:disulfide interchange protein DsbD
MKSHYLPKTIVLLIFALTTSIALSETAAPYAFLTSEMNSLETAFSNNIYWAFLLVFLAGILTSFTPCIFPMIPITLSVLGHDVEKNSRTENFLRSLFYVHGIAFTYSTLGVIAALTGSLFGNALSNKYVLSGMVILFVVMALSMWGVFELQMPRWVRKKLGRSQNSKSESYLSLFVMGLIAGVVASPCVGPVLVSILSYVSTTKNVFLGFTLLFTYAMGLGLIFIIIGLFSQVLKFLPRSGHWMNRVKFVMGLLMLGVAVYYLNFIIPIFNFIDKPISINQLVGNSPSTETTELKWIPYSEEALQKAIDRQRPVMIDFFAQWCQACHELKDKTFSKSEFKQMAADFDLIVVDATDDLPEIEKILTKYNVKGLPTVIFVNKKGTVLNNLTFTQFLEWPELKPKMQEAQKN